MLTYQARARVLRVDGPERPEFPATVAINFWYQPGQSFGMSAEGGRALVRASTPSILMNMNTGQFSVIMNPALDPLSVEIDDLHCRASLKGNQLTIVQRCETTYALEFLIEAIYFGLKLLLAIDFADPPIVERVDGLIGSVPFRWELAQSIGGTVTTTQKDQEARFATAWNRMALTGENRRLLGAACYFHTACRLRRESKWPGEFLAESLLNFCKILEVLYGSERDVVRLQLSSLGYTTEEIERDFIPVMRLRNSIDIGHPMLGLFTAKELKTLQSYADRAEPIFRGFLQKLFGEIESGGVVVPDHALGDVSSDAKKIVEELRVRLDTLGNRA